MKFYLMRLLFLLLFFSHASFLLGNTYYLDFTDGVDNRDGLSPGTAWKSLFKIRQVNSPGDIFLLKRGEVWTVPQLYLTTSGTSTQPIRFGAYGNSTDPLPIITNIAEVVNASDPMLWMETSPGIWTLSTPKPPGRLFIDGGELLRADSLHKIGFTDQEGATAYWYYEDLEDPSTDLLHLYAPGNPALLYSTIEGSREYYATLIDRADYLEFQNIDFRGGSGASFGVIGGQHIAVSYCSLGHSGVSGALALEYDNQGVRRTCSNLSFYNNLFDSNFTFMHGLGSERGCEDGVRLRNGASNCVISDNTFKNWAHNAIELLGDDPAAGGVNNNLIYNNSISAPDIPYAHPLGADGIYGKCQYNEFYNNIATNCRTASQINGNNNWVHHNVMRKMRQSPAKNNATAHGFVIGIYLPGLVCEDNRYDHNLIYDTDEAGFLVRNYGYPIQLTGNSIRNNVVINTGKNPYTQYYSYDVGTSLVIFDDTADGVSGNIIQNNAFYSDEGNAMAVYLHYAGSHYSAEDFNSLDGQQGNTISNNLDSDPLLTNVAGGNYLPTNSSPLINAALDVGLPFDLAGNDRVYGAAPDIGPLETTVLVPLPVTWGAFTTMLTNEKYALLRWEITSATNLRSFVVERSTDARQWEPIGEVSARISPIGEYTFTDVTINRSSYYRLRQLDWDGTFDFSPLSYLEYPRSASYQLTRVAPNIWRIDSQLAEDWSQANITVYTATGMPCWQVQGQAIFDTYQLPSGTYWIHLSNGNQEVSFKLIK